MQVIIVSSGTTEEIAALALALQERQSSIMKPLDTVMEAVRKAIDGIGQEEQTAS